MVGTFREFMRSKREHYNPIIKKIFPVQDEILLPRLRDGFLNSMEPSFDAMKARKGPDLDNNQEQRLDALIRLLLMAIKKRYYRFPERNIVSVNQDRLFDSILPNLMGSGMLDNSLDPFIHLFNAGENLGHLSTPFYEYIDLVLPLIIESPTTEKEFIQICAWAAGDIKRRDHALGLLEKLEKAGEFMWLIQGGQLSDLGNIPKDIMKKFKSVMVTILRSDIWRSVQEPSEPGHVEELQQLAREKKWDEAIEMLTIMETRAQSRNLPQATSIVTLDGMGRYSGFYGQFDAPPKVVGLLGDHALVASTPTGKVFHVSFGGGSIQVRALGSLACKNVILMQEAGMGIVNPQNEIVMLRDGHVIGELPKSYDTFVADSDGIFVYATQPGKKRVYYHDIHGDTSGYITAPGPVININSIDEATILVTMARNGTQQGQEVALFKDFSLERTILTESREFKIAANDGIIVTLAKDGILKTWDISTAPPSKGIPTTINLDGMTSFHATRRNLIITYNFTHRIYFLGEPR